LLRLHGRSTMDRSTLLQSTEWKNAVTLVQRLIEAHTEEMEL